MEKITGTMINYYCICKRKLWYFMNHIGMEQESEEVKIGKLIDENSYTREKKNISINDTISIDFIGQYNTIHEVKKSNKLDDSAKWQLKYYIYYLRQHGINIERGVIDYPKLKIREEVTYDNEDEIIIEDMIGEIHEIKNKNTPCVINSTICKKCAYYEFCYI